MQPIRGKSRAGLGMNSKMMVNALSLVEPLVDSMSLALVSLRGAGITLLERTWLAVSACFQFVC